MNISLYNAIPDHRLARVISDVPRSGVPGTAVRCGVPRPLMKTGLVNRDKIGVHFSQVTPIGDVSVGADEKLKHDISYALEGSGHQIVKKQPPPNTPPLLAEPSGPPSAA